MSNSAKTPKVAVVHDRLNVRGGGERVVEEIARLYPKAPIYTLIYDPNQFRGSEIAKHTIRTSFINRLPQAAARHRYYIPLMPLAIEGLELDRFDVIISSSAAFAHGVRTTPDQLHVSYIHSPMRYAWHQYEQHVSQLGFGSPPMRMLLAYLRRWDRTASQRATHMIANSQWTSSAIKKAFERDSKVIYPPVHIERFAPAEKRADYYLTASRLVPYKRVDLIVSAFSRLGLPLIVIGDGPEQKYVKRNAPANIEFRAYQPEEQFSRLMNEAKAFIYAAEEDFGIAAVEAQAAGAPVIAFGRGGLRETVVNGETGIFFDEQNEESIIATVKTFENEEAKFDPQVIRQNAQRFGVQRFSQQLSVFIDEKWELFRKQSSLHGHNEYSSGKQA
jgi:glycosyltransferase involved in cell wall biosynthesis